MRLSRVKDPIRVTCTNFFKFYINIDIISNVLENTVKKIYWDHRYFGQKMAKIGQKTAKIRFFRVNNPIRVTNSKFLSCYIKIYVIYKIYENCMKKK